MGRISKVSTTAKTKWVALAATLVVATAEALAQEKQSARVGWGQEASRTAEAGRIVVSIPDRKLALVEGGRVVKSYDVAVGADESPSPSGEFKITHRIPHPTFYAPGVIIPPGKENPLGTRWLGLNQKGYGIHGTNQPGSIGHRASHGCIRLRNRDIEELFELVRAGDVVELHAERAAELAAIFGAPRAPAVASGTLSSSVPAPVAAAHATVGATEQN